MNGSEVAVRRLAQLPPQAAKCLKLCPTFALSSLIIDFREEKQHVGWTDRPMSEREGNMRDSASGIHFESH